MSFQDEIVEEVRKARDAYAARFDYDLARMFEDLKEKAKQNPGKRAKIEPVRPRERRA